MVLDLTFRLSIKYFIPPEEETFEEAKDVTGYQLWTYISILPED